VPSARGGLLEESTFWHGQPPLRGERDLCITRGDATCNFEIGKQPVISMMAAAEG
jgi:hypothetical protein